MQNRLRWKAYLLITLLALVSVRVAASQPDDLRINVLLTGRVTERHLISSWFRNEPLIDPLLVPSRGVAGGESQIRKFIRVYFPRNYETVKSQDFMVFAGTIMNMFTPTQHKWMHDAVLEGTGGLNSRSVLSGIYYPEWAVTSTQKAFPNDVEALLASPSEIHRSGCDLEIIVRTDLPPVFSMFIDKKIRWRLTDYSCGRVIPREGATIWMWLKGPFADLSTIKPDSTPHTISWRYGEGLTWTCHDRLVNWWQDPIANPYGLDMIMNMILHSTGRSLPDDVEIVHDIRSKVVDFNTRMILLLGTIEFAESFGANMAPVFDGMDDVMDSKGEADGMYLGQDYERAWSAYRQCIQELQDLNDVAMERKDRALIWIYLVQWLVVSATLLVAGFFLWSVMIRRRLYREVSHTSFRRTGTE